MAFETITGYLGIPTIFLIAFLFSEKKTAVRPRIVLAAFGVQAGIAVFALYAPFGQTLLPTVSRGVQAIIDHAFTGIRFLFGDLAGDKPGGPIFAITVLPIIIFVSSLMGALYHLRIMQYVVLILGGFLQKVIGTSRVESMCAAANIFVGPIEAPLAVRPYLKRLSRARLFAVMATGLSSVTGAILLGYASLGVRLDYLIAAAFMAPAGGLLMAKILVPETDTEKDEEKVALDINSFDGVQRRVNVIEAAADGAAQGLRVAAHVGAMLIAFISLISLLNGAVSFLGGFIGFPELTIETLLGFLFSPLMLLLGIPWEDAIAAGNLIGQKTILNEFIAFVQFIEIRETLNDHTQAVVTFALCGFANLNALAIIFGGLGGLVPERKSEIAQLGLKAILAGALSNLMSAALAGAVLSLSGT